MPYANKTVQKEAQRQWYLKHKEITRQRSNNWKRENKDKIRDYDKKYRAANPDKYKEYAKRYTKKIVDELADSYMCDQLQKYGIPSSFSGQYPEVLETEREYFLLIRLLKTISKMPLSKRPSNNNKNKKKVEFVEVNDATDLRRAFNVNRQALANGDRTLEEARVETNTLGKILMAERTHIASSVALKKEPDMTFFKPKEPAPKKKK